MSPGNDTNKIHHGRAFRYKIDSGSASAIWGLNTGTRLDLKNSRSNAFLPESLFYALPAETAHQKPTNYSI